MGAVGGTPPSCSQPSVPWWAFHGKIPGVSFWVKAWLSFHASLRVHASSSSRPKAPRPLHAHACVLRKWLQLLPTLLAPPQTTPPPPLNALNTTPLESTAPSSIQVKTSSTGRGASGGRHEEGGSREWLWASKKKEGDPLADFPNKPCF